MSKIDRNTIDMVDNLHVSSTIVCGNCGLQQVVELVDDPVDAAMFFIDCGWTIDKKTEDPVCKHCSAKNKKKK